MTGRINAFHDAVVSKIKAAVPGAISVERQFGRFNLDELERNSIRCPAVRFAALTAKVPSSASGQQSGNLSCAAFVVVDGKEREVKAWALAEAVATLAHSSQMWGLTKVGVPEKVAVQPMISALIKDKGIVIIAVEWSQDIRQLGEDIFAGAGLRLEELFINGEEIELQSEGGDDVQP